MDEGCKMKVRKKKDNSGKERSLLGYRITRDVNVSIWPDVFLTPFEVLNLHLSITLESILITETD